MSTKYTTDETKYQVAVSDLRPDPYSAIPALLRQRPQWVVWKHHNGKKPPCNPETARATDPQDQAIWLSFAQAVAVAQADSRFDGIGYVFTPDDQFVGIDLDDCLADGRLDERAQRIVRALASYTEISPSGAGVKVFIRAELAANPTGLAAGVEIYTNHRFFTVTGRSYPGTPAAINPVSIELLSGIIEKYTVVASQERPGAMKPQKGQGDTARQPGRIVDKPIEAYNAGIDLRSVLDRNGGRRDGTKLYHCPCGVHRGVSGSLVLKKSYNYGIVITGKNPACVFFGRNFASFDVMCTLEHNGDKTKAISAARNELNMPIQREYAPLEFRPKAPAPAAARAVSNPASLMQSVIARAAKDDTLTKATRRVLSALIDHASEGYASLTVAQLVSLTGLSESSVQRATRSLHGVYLAKLEDANPLGGNVANLYRFIGEPARPAAPAVADFDTPYLVYARAENDTPFLEVSKIGGEESARTKNQNPTKNQESESKTESRAKIAKPEQESDAPKVSPPILPIPENQQGAVFTPQPEPKPESESMLVQTHMHTTKRVGWLDDMPRDVESLRLYIERNKKKAKYHFAQKQSESGAKCAWKAKQAQQELERLERRALERSGHYTIPPASERPAARPAATPAPAADPAGQLHSSSTSGAATIPQPDAYQRLGVMNRSALIARASRSVAELVN